MEAIKPALSRIQLALGLGCASLTLLPPLLGASQAAWLPAMVLVAVLGWRRMVRAAFALAVAGFLLVAIAEGRTFGADLLPVAALWLLATVALRRRPRPEPPVSGRFEAILEQSELITLVIDGRDCASYANPAFLRLLDLELPRLVGRDAVDLFDPQDRELLRERLAAAREAPGDQAMQLPRLRLSTPADQLVYLQARLSRIERGFERGSLVLSATEVTGRIRAESALAGSETRFASLFATSRDALLITRATDGTVMDFNETFTALTGWTPAEGVGASVNRVVPLADPGDLGRIFHLLDRDGEFVDYECALIRRDGRIVETTISGRYAEIDGDRCVVSVLRDITESRRTEMALAESEEKFARIFHRSPDAMSIVRLADGVIIDVNDRFVELFQRPQATIVGRTVLELQPGFDLSTLTGHREPGGAAEDASEFANVEIELDLAGLRVPTLVSTTISEINGEPCAISLIKDMSELAQARRALEESEALFRGAFEHAPIGMVLIDPADGSITQVNRKLCDLIGYDEEELIGEHIASILPADYHKGLLAVRDGLYAQGTESSLAETRYVRRDGRAIWTNRHIVLQRAPDGTPVSIIAQITDVTALKESREQMEKLAFYDTLTGLANRRLFTDRLEQAVRHAVRSRRPTALMYLDLDNFKRVNDSLGHEAGDELLRIVAERLQRCVRDEDTVGRFGGDEFTILLNQVRDGRSAASVARKVISALAESIVVANHEFRVTTSIGVTMAPDDGTDPQTLIKNADLAMYRAKERGRDNYQFFSEDMNTRAMDRLILENELRTAIVAGEFELFYQPQVSVTSGTIVGMEALVRWRHPRRGLLAPDDFIQVAEESGLIVPLGEWSIARACTQMHAMRERTGLDVQIAVNISARQFADPNLPDLVRRSLEQSGLAAPSLELEITETMLMHDMEEAIRTLQVLHELGVSLAVDDFGTGYSSLNYLKRLPIDRVKVDRSFVSDIPHSEDDVAITSAVIAMAHQLNLDVIAEGVETQEQLDFLAAADCEMAQGFLFGPPLPYADAERIVGEHIERTGVAGA